MNSSQAQIAVAVVTRPTLNALKDRNGPNASDPATVVEAA
jgi:hypothetical protein